MLDAERLVTIDAVTVTMIVCAVGWLDAFVLHVLSARLCGVLLFGRHPGPGTQGLVEAGSGQSRRRDHTNPAFNPTLGQWSGVKTVVPGRATASVWQLVPSGASVTLCG